MKDITSEEFEQVLKDCGEWNGYKYALNLLCIAYRKLADNCYESNCELLGDDHLNTARNIHNF